MVCYAKFNLSLFLLSFRTMRKKKWKNPSRRVGGRLVGRADEVKGRLGRAEMD